MKIVIAPQEFKGSLTAAQAAAAMAEGVRRVLPEAALELAPVADGGPGTVDAVVAARGGRLMHAMVHDPLGRPLTAQWGLVDGEAAVIEMAAAAGLSLLRPEERDPRLTSTYGVGELISAALDAGCRRIIVGLGGSATNDGGAGLAQALGARLLDGSGRDLPPGGAALSRLDFVDTSGLDPRLRECQLLAACDVLNPLLGPQGASVVYGPQKGATPETVHELEAALARYAQVIERDVGIRVVDMPGAAAAGGLGAGLMAFLGAELRSGFELVAEVIGLRERLLGAHLVLTGEGRLDAQTAYGKAVLGVAKLAKECSVPAVVAIVGSLGEGWRVALEGGIDAVVTITPGPITVEEAMARAAELVADAAEQAARLVMAGWRAGGYGD